MGQSTHLRRFGVALLFLALPAVGARATTVDLVSNASGALNGAQFIQFASLGAGSGALDAFVRYQASGSAVTQGYNVDVAGQGDYQYDEVYGSFTHSLFLSDVPIVEYEGTLYREFCFDINETAGSETLLSLDAVEIHLADAGTLLGHPAFPGGTTTLVYDMDAGDATNHVRLDAAISGPGSGSVDMMMLVPASLFSGIDPSLDQLILYSRVGGEGGYFANSDGFEEWAVSMNGGVVPEPATFSLVAIGLASLALARKRLR
jgi:hypothetical protein